MRNAPIFLDRSKEYSRYYDTPSPQWVLDIATKLKESLNIVG